MRQLTLISALVMALSATTAVADDVKVLEKTIDAQNFTRLVLDVPVGEIKVKVTKNNDISLVVELEPDEGWFSSRKDLSDAQISVQENGSALKLKIDLEDDNDVNQNWTVMMPADIAVSLNLGVGSVEVDDLTSDINVDLGVGEVDIDVDTSLFDSIKLDAGVGDTSIKGGKGRYERDQVLVTSSSQLHGEGKKQLDANVGVGDIEVRDNQ
ncbi:MAG: hypothetical protein KJ556_17940 [Gammaproteobacteria bacterium]|nr:hypothetical protein [Gammaproteobacteria bacterium]MBU2058729.1 hypothetical protein [Gammaproteobacteria bacterium]MBU2176986.1 hypothetical protein [Gammaproteobacteria bacterium]MBU2246433.1 hypothetical protein [Gammaproteobacteria bacterium]MBU2345426.1 hypothetical protein [Gammaproteobacteria bacterium]